MKVETMKTADLKPYEKNAKKHPPEQVEQIANSIKEFGWQQPLVVDKNNGVVIGHGRLLAAKKLGIDEEPCVRADDLTEEQVKALRLADNKTNESEWDFGLLDGELADIVDIDMSQFGFDEAKNEDVVVEDEYDETLSENPVAKNGDIWQLGKHRIICGDSTQAETFDRLMSGKSAVMAVTSPPYGVGKDYEEKGITPWRETMLGVINNITKYAKIIVWNLGDLYSTGTQFVEPTSFYSHEMFAEKGFRPIWIRIWEKQGMNFGVGPYHLVTNKPVQQYEYISAFADEHMPVDIDEYNDEQYWWLSAYANSQFKFVKRLTREERKKWGYAGIWKINTVKANKEHPAMFPVELPWRCIKMHSDVGDNVLEPFCGSGTTIIACEQLARNCYAVERDPKYCDVAIRRWENFTGEKAVLIDGK